MISACLKTEELRWGSPTATTPFEPLDFAPKGDTEIFLSCHELNGQFDKLTDRSKGTLVPELVEGARCRLRQLRVYGVSFLAFNIHGFPAFAENDGLWFLSPEGVK